MKTAAAPRKKTLPKHSPAKGTCMMFLRINGVFYKVHPLPPEHGCRAYKLHKQAQDGTVEAVCTVKESNIGISCDCADFRNRRKGRDDACKHCKSLRAYYMIGGVE